MTSTSDRPRREDLARQLQVHSAKKGAPYNLLVTAVEVGGSLLLFHLARSEGASDVASYLIGSIAPLIGGLMIWARARKFSGASAAIFSFTMVSAVIALIGSTDAKVLLYKDCAATALIGLVFLASCVVMRKPVVFYMAQRFGTDGTREGMTVYDSIWDVSREFRVAMYVISGVWAAVFLLQAAVTALIIKETSYSTGYDYDQTLPIVAVVVGIVISGLIGRRTRTRAQAAAAASAAQNPAAAGDREPTPNS